MLSFREKIAKIGSADPEIICLPEIIKKKIREEKKEINASQIYSPIGNLAERAKLPGNERQSIAIARQTKKWRLLQHIWTIMLKLHLINLLSICYTANFATNTVTNQTNGAEA